MIPILSDPTITALPGSRYGPAAHLGDLVRIFDDDIDVCMHPRPAQPLLARYLRQVAMEGELSSGLEMIVEAESASWSAALPDGSGRELLIADLQHLVQLFVELLGCPRVGLRLRVLERAMCPRFHVDQTTVRMLCTYFGPGTEWLDERAANRQKLGTGANGLADTNSGLVLDPAEITRAPTFALVLLKGCAWPRNAHRGAIHRSPAADAEAPWRALVSLDAVW